MKTNELEFITEKIVSADFQSVLSKIKKDEMVLLDFSRTRSIESDLAGCGQNLKEVLKHCHTVIILGPSFLQPLIDKFSGENLVYIIKTSHERNVATPLSPDEAVELIKTISLEFFRFHFGDLQFRTANHVSDLEIRAAVRVSLLGEMYVYSLMMTTPFFLKAVEKILLISIEGDVSDYLDLVAEVLNMMCGHLRSGIVPTSVQVKLEIPQNKSQEPILSWMGSTPVWAVKTQMDDVVISFSKEN